MHTLSTYLCRYLHIINAVNKATFNTLEESENAAVSSFLVLAFYYVTFNHIFHKMTNKLQFVCNSELYYQCLFCYRIIVSR